MMADVLKAYILQNWILVLVLIAFAIILFTNIFVTKKSTIRMIISIVFVFALSIAVFAEFYITPTEDNIIARKILMAIRYSATPIIVALISFAFIRKLKPFIFIPAGVLLTVNIISIFVPIVFDLKDVNTLVRGPLGYLPYIVAGLYLVFLIYILIRHSNKRAMETVPIVFLSLAFLSGMVFPFVFGADYSKIFCSIIGVALFIYYVFTILQLSKKDALTGLLNRSSYYAEMSHVKHEVSAIISLDMNGLKIINDTNGHPAGDEALATIGACFFKACKARQSAYRMGGDEFVVVCLKTSEDEVKALVERLKKYVGETEYTCSVGYSYNTDGTKTVEQMLKESDQAMYVMKEEYRKSLTYFSKKSPTSI